MRNFLDTFETSAFPICMTVPLILAFEGQDGTSNPFNFILNSLAGSIDLKVPLGCLFRWSTILREFSPRLIPMSDEYGGLMEKGTVENKDSNTLTDAKIFEFNSHRICFAFDFHKCIIYSVKIADPHNRHCIKSVRIRTRITPDTDTSRSAFHVVIN